MTEFLGLIVNELVLLVQPYLTPDLATLELDFQDLYWDEG